jgi:non-ribosomal peptide synthetase component F
MPVRRWENSTRCELLAVDLPQVLRDSVLESSPLRRSARSVVDFAGLRATFLEVDPGTCKFDVALSLADDETSIAGMIEYSTELFDTETIARVRDRFERLLRAAAADPERRVSELPFMSVEEQDVLRCFVDGGATCSSTTSNQISLRAAFLYAQF